MYFPSFQMWEVVKIAINDLIGSMMNQEASDTYSLSSLFCFDSSYHWRTQCSTIGSAFILCKSLKKVDLVFQVLFHFRSNFIEPRSWFPWVLFQVQYLYASDTPGGCGCSLKISKICLISLVRDLSSSLLMIYFSLLFHSFHHYASNYLAHTFSSFEEKENPFFVRYCSLAIYHNFLLLRLSLSISDELFPHLSLHQSFFVTLLLPLLLINMIKKLFFTLLFMHLIY